MSWIGLFKGKRKVIMQNNNRALTIARALYISHFFKICFCVGIMRGISDEKHLALQGVVVKPLPHPAW